MNCLGEIPVFFLSGPLIARIGRWAGLALTKKVMMVMISTWAMTTVLVAHGARLIYYSCMSAPWQVINISITCMQYQGNQ